MDAIKTVFKLLIFIPLFTFGQKPAPQSLPT